MLDVLKYSRKPAQRVSAGKGAIGIASVSITFGRGSTAHHAVAPTSLTIAPGEFVCILGPSGCGKSTLLNAIAGYVRPTEGHVTVDGIEIEETRPRSRHGVSAIFPAALEDGL